MLSKSQKADKAAAARNLFTAILLNVGREPSTTMAALAVEKQAQIDRIAGRK